MRRGLDGGRSAALLAVILAAGACGLALAALQLNRTLQAGIPACYLAAAPPEALPPSDAADGPLQSWHYPLYCQYQGRSLEAAGIATSADPSGFAGVRLVSGNFYRVSPLMEENCWAVIDEELALKLFMTDQVCGRTLWLGDTPYTLCGVAAEQNGFLQQIAGEGIPRIYLPANSPEGRQAGGSLLWCARSTAASRQRAAEFFCAAGADVAAEAVADLPVLRNTLNALASGALALLTVSLLVLGWGLLCRRLPDGLVRAGRRIAALAALAGPLGTFLAAVPQEVLPPDNVFALGYYRDELAALMQAANRMGGPLGSCLRLCGSGILVMAAFLLAGEVLVLLQICLTGRR